MPHYAQIKDGVVQEVREFDDIEGRFHPSLTWVEADDTVTVGDRYVDGEFLETPTCLVKLGDDNVLEAVRIQPRERLEDEDGWIEASEPTDVETDDGWKLVRYYYPESDEWDHKQVRTNPDDQRRNYVSEDSREAIREALDNGDVERAAEELAHIVTGDDRFSNPDAD